MKLAGQKALAYCDKPKAQDKAVLIFSSDPGLVSSAADTLIANRLPELDPINVVRINDDNLKGDDAMLADELVARSLLGGDRLVRLRMDKETYAKQVIALLADIDSGALAPEAFWVVEAKDLGKSSKLRAAFEDSKSALALHLFADDESTVTEFAETQLREAGVAIEPDALAAFCAELPGDRRLAISEVEKLKLYALDLGRPLTLDDILSIAAAEQPRGADVAADAAILGDVKSSTVAINRFLDAGGSPISAMRTLHFRMQRVMDAAAMERPSGRALRPPVFDKEWPAFQRALRDWTPSRIQKAFSQLYTCEKACKQAGAPADAILGQLILSIARRHL